MKGYNQHITTKLVRLPKGLTCLPSGELVLLSYSEEGTFCEAYDASLAPVWSTRLERYASAMITDADGTLWLLDAEGALALGDRGVRSARVKARAPEGMHSAAFAQVEGGFVFAWQHTRYEPVCPPVLQRVNDDGEVRWSTTLPLEPIAYKGLVQMSAAEGWKRRPVPAWRPRSWIYSSSAVPLTVSGDAVLACFEDYDSGIGFGYVVSLEDGTLRFTTKKGPIGEVASLGGGAFLVGYLGYGAFETLRYERDGQVGVQWPSEGYYVISDGDVRVIEMDNSIPSKNHLVRLLPGGAVEKGDWLAGYPSSRPHLRADGTVFFFRDGSLWAARDLALDHQLVLFSPDDRAYINEVVGNEQGLYFAYRDPDLKPNEIGGGHLVRVGL